MTHETHSNELADEQELLQRLLDAARREFAVSAVSLYVVGDEAGRLARRAALPHGSGPDHISLKHASFEHLARVGRLRVDHGMRSVSGGDDSFHVFAMPRPDLVVLFCRELDRAWPEDVDQRAVSVCETERKLIDALPVAAGVDTRPRLAALVASFAAEATSTNREGWASFSNVWLARLARSFGSPVAAVFRPIEGGYRRIAAVYADGTARHDELIAWPSINLPELLRRDGYVQCVASDFQLSVPVSVARGVIIAPITGPDDDVVVLVDVDERWNDEDLLAFRSIALIGGQARSRAEAERSVQERLDFEVFYSRAGQIATRTILENETTTLQQLLSLMTEHFAADTVGVWRSNESGPELVAAIVDGGDVWDPASSSATEYFPFVDEDGKPYLPGDLASEQPIIVEPLNGGSVAIRGDHTASSGNAWIMLWRRERAAFDERSLADLAVVTDLLAHVRQRLASDRNVRRQLELDRAHSDMMSRLVDAGHDDAAAFAAFSEHIRQIGADTVTIWRFDLDHEFVNFWLLHESSHETIGDVASTFGTLEFRVPRDSVAAANSLVQGYNEWRLEDTPLETRAILEPMCPPGPRRVLAVRASEPTDTGETDWMLVSAARTSPFPESDARAISRAFTELTNRHARVRAEAWFQAAYETAPIAISLRDEHGHLMYCNGAYETLTGRDLAELRGTDRSFCTEGDAPDRIPPSTGSAEFGITYVRPSGERRLARVRVTNLQRPGSDKDHSLTFVEDITDRRRNEDQLAFQATHDDLTNLPNRRALLAVLDSVAQTDTPYSVVLLDLDRFKIVNDSLGHSAGDRMLISCADRLRLAVRPSDTLARLGGDEFAVIVQGPDVGLTTEAMAERLLGVLRQPMWVDHEEIFPTASIGIATPDGDDKPEDVLRHADAAMYAAKAAGRDRYAVFDTRLRTNIAERTRLETEVRRAQENDQLELFYQPEFDLTSGQLTGAEALLRWNHPTRGLLTAAEFIGVVEDTGAVVDIGSWILDTACTQAAQWARDGWDLVTRVNVSARQLRPALVQDVAEALARTGLPPDRLCLELTESAVMRDPAESALLLSQLRSLGAQVAIDDFGTGFSSLAYLKRFDVDVLKIDRAFVSGVADGGDDMAIVESIMSLASALRLQVVAEGIESADQLNALRQLGCRSGQGWLWAEAEPHEAFTERLRVISHERAEPPRH